ncbi:lipoprotein [Klebsiella oxytoca]|nr:lipoprotein [Klebsiella oxytoca]
MAWADDNLALPDESQFPGFIQRCCHFVSAHEQRLCFPLDSVRRTEGNYPASTFEVVYPGVHSDVGGGYARGGAGEER